MGDPSFVRYIGGRKFLLAVLVLLCGTGLAAFDKLTPTWVSLAVACLGAFTAANLWMESKGAPSP